MVSFFCALRGARAKLVLQLASSCKNCGSRHCFSWSNVCTRICNSRAPLPFTCSSIAVAKQTSIHLCIYIATLLLHYYPRFSRRWCTAACPGVRPGAIHVKLSLTRLAAAPRSTLLCARFTLLLAHFIALLQVLLLIHHYPVSCWWFGGSGSGGGCDDTSGGLGSGRCAGSPLTIPYFCHSHSSLSLSQGGQRVPQAQQQAEVTSRPESPERPGSGAKPVTSHRPKSPERLVAILRQKASDFREAIAPRKASEAENQWLQGGQTVDRMASEAERKVNNFR